MHISTVVSFVTCCQITLIITHNRMSHNSGLYLCVQQWLSHSHRELSLLGHSISRDSDRLFKGQIIFIDRKSTFILPQQLGTIRYDTTILTCAQKPTTSQLSHLKFNNQLCGQSGRIAM